jgi:hypothetical protein
VSAHNNENPDKTGKLNKMQTPETIEGAWTENDKI